MRSPDSIPGVSSTRHHPDETDGGPAEIKLPEGVTAFPHMRVADLRGR
jgi:hypothetical protein